MMYSFEKEIHAYKRINLHVTEWTKNFQQTRKKDFQEDQRDKLESKTKMKIKINMEQSNVKTKNKNPM